jgi:hypothetical protein
MGRCENCGKENKQSEATICPSCLHHKRKQELRAAKEAIDAGEAPPSPPPGPDLDDLRERMRRIKDTLAE